MHSHKKIPLSTEIRAITYCSLRGPDQNVVRYSYHGKRARETTKIVAGGSKRRRERTTITLLGDDAGVEGVWLLG